MEGWAVARDIGLLRKVRTPRSSLLPNGKAASLKRRADGKCHREQTANPACFFASVTEAMVKRWGKSPPALWVTRVARQTPGGARSSRAVLGTNPSRVAPSVTL